MQSGLLSRINYPVPQLILGTKNWGEFADLPEARSQLRTYLAAGGYGIELNSSGKNLAIAGELLAELTNRAHFQVHFNLNEIQNTAQAQRDIHQALSETNLDYFDVIWTSFDVKKLAPGEISRLISQNIKNEKTLYFGLNKSEFWQFVYLQENLRSESINFAGLKTIWSLVERELTNEELNACELLQVSILATRCLGLGLLTGKYQFNTPSDSMLARGNTELNNLLTSTNSAKIQALATAADGIGVSLTEMALAWVLSNQQVSGGVINARNSSQLNQILKSVKLEIPAEIKAALDEVGNFE